jgi:hypothetical protein
MREKKPVVGTIVGVFDGTLDSIQARLITRTRLGYLVELLETKDAFRRGDRVHVSVAEFQITTEAASYYHSVPDGVQRSVTHSV